MAFGSLEWHSKIGDNHVADRIGQVKDVVRAVFWRRTWKENSVELESVKINWKENWARTEPILWCSTLKTKSVSPIHRDGRRYHLQKSVDGKPEVCYSIDLANCLNGSDAKSEVVWKIGVDAQETATEKI